MNTYRYLSDSVLVSAQIAPDEMDRLTAEGVRLIVNNRPDGEAPDQPSGARVAAAAQAAGIAYAAMPITHAGFSLPQIEAFADLLDSAEGKVLAYCRSGTRSSLLWALAQAKAGRDPQAIEQALDDAGYDLAPVRPVVDMLTADRPA